MQICSDQTAVYRRQKGPFSRVKISYINVPTMVWSIYIICAMHEKGPYVICGQRRPVSACAYAKADLGIRCLLAE